MPRKKKMPNVEEILTALETSTGREKQRILTKLSKLMDSDSRVQKVFSNDMDSHLTDCMKPITCPKCGSIVVVKNGFRSNGHQEYKCQDCGSKFTLAKGTLLEKTKMPWGVWVEVIYQMLHLQSIQSIKKVLESEYDLEGVHDQTILNMQLKIMHAAKYVPSPFLRDVIEVDETSIHEAQKGSRALVDPLDDSKGRQARKRWEASQYGSLGPEFGTILCAVDHTGHVIASFAGVGAATISAFESKIAPYLKDVRFICSDANSLYSSYCNQHHINHYCRPSYTNKRIEKALKDKTSIALLYRNGMIDSISGYELNNLSYEEFKDIKKRYKLGLNYVNGFHSRLKQSLVADKHGITLKNIPYYIAWLVLLENWRVDHNVIPQTYQDAEDILKTLVLTRANITRQKLVESKPDFTTIDVRFKTRLIRDTKKIRSKQSTAYYITNEDYSTQDSLRIYLENLPAYMLQFLGKELKIKGYSTVSKNRTYKLRKQLEKHPNIEEAIQELIIRYGSHKEE